MPTNVTPEFKKAKEAFRSARDPQERLSCLKEMLKTVPKHKGTDHLQAEIKTRIKALTDELAGPKKGGARTGPAHTVPPDGAAQIAILGPPNSGKSTLHDHLTGSHAETGPYPHTTNTPQPGMFLYDDVPFQLVDLPPVSADYMETWMPNALQPAHAVLLVVDLSAAGCVENVAAIKAKLAAKRISLVPAWPGNFENVGLDVLPGPASAEDQNSDSDEDDPFRLFVPTMVIAAKSDLEWDPEEIEILEDLIGVRYPALSISVTTGDGVEKIGRALFDGLGVVRVYTKIPGQPADHSRPFTVFEGDTVKDVARLVHRELAVTLKYAKIWGSAKFDGQQVGKDHVVADGDIVELHG